MRSAPGTRTRPHREHPPALRNWAPLLLGAAVAVGLWMVDERLSTPASGGDEPRTTELGPLESGREILGPSAALVTAEGPGLLGGTVSDPDGRAIRGAVIRLGPSRTVTGSRGRFSLLPADGELIIEHDDHFPLRLLSDELEKLPPTPDGELHLVLLPGQRIRGRVVDSKHRPIERVEVVLESDLGGPLTSVFTSEEGEWTSPLVFPGPIHALFRHPSYRTSAAQWTVERTAPLPVVETVLLAGTPLAITVAARSGEPLADADLWLETLDAGGGHTVSESIYLGRTGDLGELATSIEPGVAARVRARRAGYRERSSAVVRGRVEITLEPAPALRARAILASTGLPIEPVRVELELRDPDEIAPAFRSIAHRGALFRGFADGEILVGLPPRAGRYAIVVDAEGSLHGVSPEVEFDGKSSPPPVIVRLEREERLAGVIHSHGAPVEGADVELVLLGSGTPGSASTFIEGEATPVLFRTRSRASGRFDFNVLPRTACRLVVRHPEFAEWTSPPLPLPFVAAYDYPIELRRGGVIRGRVLLPGGGGAADLAVVLVAPAMEPRTEWSDADGRFAFENLGANEAYEVAVAPLDARGEPVLSSLRENDDARRTVPLGPEAEVEVELASPSTPWGSLEGSVTLAGRPLSTEVRLLANDISKRVREIPTDAEGRFLARGLPPGEYSVSGVTVPITGACRIEAGQRARIELASETLTLQVEITAEGEPLGTAAIVDLKPAGARLRLAYDAAMTSSLVYVEGAPTLRQSVRLGRATFEGLLPGTHELEIRARGYLAATRTLEIERDGSVRVDLERGQVLRIRLRTPSGSAFRGEADVVILRRGETVWSARRRVDGMLELPPLARGTYELSVRAEGWKLEKRVTVPPEEP